MRVGLHALGIGAGARREVIDQAARSAEEAGFATLWAGEHVVMVDEAGSRYPYADDGRLPIPADADWLDPLIGLSFAAAATHRIRLGTGVLLLPEHNPVLVAKQVASLDCLSGGRLVLGVGIGWSAEEFAALGVPFDRRGQRAEEQVVAIRTLWHDDVATFRGEFVSFEAVRVNPRPMRNRRVPVFFGGNSVGALRRAARLGDGWYGFNLTLPQVAERVGTLRRLCEEHDRGEPGLEIAVALAGGRPEQRRELVALGVDEVVVVAAPPGDPGAVPPWIDRLADEWIR